MPVEFLKFKYIQLSGSRTKTLHRLASAVRDVRCARRRRSFDRFPGFVQSGRGSHGPSGPSIYVSSLDYAPGAGDRRIVDPLLLGAARNMVDRLCRLRLCFRDARQRHRPLEFFDPQACVDVRSLYVAAVGDSVAQPGNRDCPPYFLASISSPRLEKMAETTLRMHEKRRRKVLVRIMDGETPDQSKTAGQVVPTSLLSPNFW
jgi:hypothetical protein